MGGVVEEGGDVCTSGGEYGMERWGSGGGGIRTRVLSFLAILCGWRSVRLGRVGCGAMDDVDLWLVGWLDA